MKTVTIHFDVKAGQLRIDNLPALTQWLAAHEGQHGRATFEPTDHSKRGRVLRFYRYVLLPRAAEHHGYDVGEMHRTFYGHVTGAWLAVGRIAQDLETMTDEQLTTFVAAAVRISAENGCVIQERP